MNDKFTNKENQVFNTNELVILTKADNYFSVNNDSITSFDNIVKKNNTNISLRLIDWFVSHYSKTYDIIINNDDDNILNKEISIFEYISKNSTSLNININYIDNINKTTKIYFDPFCRKRKIIYHSSIGDIHTSIGQINFFRWLLENNILEYIKNNLESIDNNMKINGRNNKLKKDIIKKEIEKIETLYNNDDDDTETMITKEKFVMAKGCTINNLVSYDSLKSKKIKEVRKKYSVVKF